MGPEAARAISAAARERLEAIRCYSKQAAASSTRRQRSCVMRRSNAEVLVYLTTKIHRAGASHGPPRSETPRKASWRHEDRRPGVLPYGRPEDAADFASIPLNASRITATVVAEAVWPGRNVARSVVDSLTIQLHTSQSVSPTLACLATPGAVLDALASDTVAAGLQGKRIAATLVMTMDHFAVHWWISDVRPVRRPDQYPGGTSPR
jgi:hypothetical protein